MESFHNGMSHLIYNASLLLQIPLNAMLYAIQCYRHFYRYHVIHPESPIVRAFATKYGAFPIPAYPPEIAHSFKPELEQFMMQKYLYGTNPHLQSTNTTLPVHHTSQPQQQPQRQNKPDTTMDESTLVNKTPLDDDSIHRPAKFTPHEQTISISDFFTMSVLENCFADFYQQYKRVVYIDPILIAISTVLYSTKHYDCSRRQREITTIFYFLLYTNHLDLDASPLQKHQPLYTTSPTGVPTIITPQSLHKQTPLHLDTTIHPIPSHVLVETGPLALFAEVTQSLFPVDDGPSGGVPGLDNIPNTHQHPSQKNSKSVYQPPTAYWGLRSGVADAEPILLRTIDFQPPYILPHSILLLLGHRLLLPLPIVQLAVAMATDSVITGLLHPQESSTRALMLRTVNVNETVAGFYHAPTLAVVALVLSYLMYNANIDIPAHKSQGKSTFSSPQHSNDGPNVSLYEKAQYAASVEHPLLRALSNHQEKVHQQKSLLTSDPINPSTPPAIGGHTVKKLTTSFPKLYKAAFGLIAKEYNTLLSSLSLGDANMIDFGLDSSLGGKNEDNDDDSSDDDYNFDQYYKTKQSPQQNQQHAILSQFGLVNSPPSHNHTPIEQYTMDTRKIKRALYKNSTVNDDSCNKNTILTPTPASPNVVPIPSARRFNATGIPKTRYTAVFDKNGQPIKRPSSRSIYAPHTLYNSFYTMIIHTTCLFNLIYYYSYISQLKLAIETLLLTSTHAMLRYNKLVNRAFNRQKRRMQKAKDGAQPFSDSQTQHQQIDPTEHKLKIVLFIQLQIRRFLLAIYYSIVCHIKHTPDVPGYYFDPYTQLPTPNSAMLETSSSSSSTTTATLNLLNTALISNLSPLHQRALLTSDPNAHLPYSIFNRTMTYKHDQSCKQSGTRPNTDDGTKKVKKNKINRDDLGGTSDIDGNEGNTQINSGDMGTSQYHDNVFEPSYKQQRILYNLRIGFGSCFLTVSQLCRIFSIKFVTFVQCFDHMMQIYATHDLRPGLVGIMHGLDPKQPPAVYLKHHPK